MRPETETLDKLYLEWSQFTTAKTARELALEDALLRIQSRAFAGDTVESAYIQQLVSNVLNARRPSAGNLTHALQGVGAGV